MKTSGARSPKTRDDRPNPFEVGDILMSRSGREGENVSFAQVIEVRGDRLVIRDIEHEQAGDLSGGAAANPAGDYVVASRGKFRDRPESKAVKWDAQGKPYIAVGREREEARRWDGSRQLNYAGSAAFWLRQKGVAASPRH